MNPNKFLIEGIDYLGKSALVQDLKDELGYFLTLHYKRPENLKYYQGDLQKSNEASLATLFHLLRTPFADLIIDRAHLSESVYAPRYRGYSGDYVFDMEWRYQLEQVSQFRLILLTEDFDISKHFKDDGDSHDISRRIEEQDAFIDAFERSVIKDKRRINVTAPDGTFRNRSEILREVLA